MSEGDLLAALGAAALEFSDAEGRVLGSASPNLTELTGYPLDELLGEGTTPFRALVQPEDLALLVQAIADSRELRRPYDCQIRIRCRDGSVRRMREYGVAKAGRFRALLTPQDGTVEALAGGNWYRSLVEQANDALLVLDGLTVIDCNAAAERLFGETRSRLLGRTPLDLSPDVQPDGRSSREVAREYIAGLDRGESQRFDWEHRRRNGDRFPAEVALSRVADASGARVVAVVRDITDRKLSEEALRRSEQLFRAAFERAPFAVSMTDAAGRYIDVNEAFLETVARERGDVLGRTASDLGLISEDERKATLARLEKEGHVREQEIAFPRAGARCTLLTSTSRVSLDGFPLALTTAVDVTKQKQAEGTLREANELLELRVAERTAELARANEELGRALSQLVQSETLAGLGAVVAGVAHELNTPLGNVVTVSTTLTDIVRKLRSQLESGAPLKRAAFDAFLAQCAEAAAIIEKNAARAHELVHDFKQVAADQTSTRRREFDLRETVEEVLTTMQHRLRQTPHRLVLDVPPGLVLDSYPGPVQQILANFVENSLLHGLDPARPGVMRVAAEARDDLVVLAYEDDGKGIPPAVLKRMFEPFFTTRLGSGGSGLGLYITYNLATAVLGGTITATSPTLEEGGGARFELAIPRVAARRSPPRAALGRP